MARLLDSPETRSKHPCTCRTQTQTKPDKFGFQICITLELTIGPPWHLPKDFEHFMEIFLALLSNHVPSLCPPEARLAKVLDFWRVFISILPLYWRTRRFRSNPKWCITHLAWFSSARWEFNLTDICGSLKFQFCSSSLDVTLTLRVWLLSVSC